MMAIVLVAVMTMMYTVPAVFAADHEVSTGSTTHTYQIYQIFTGDYDATSGQLQNLKYGSNAKTGTTGQSVSGTDMAALDTIAKASYADDQAKITALSPYVDLTTTPVAEIGKGKESSADLAEGYYIIKDTDNSLSDPETYTLYMFEVLGNDLTVTPKDGTTTVDKTVTETDDTAGTTTPGKKGADYDEGDSIPFSIPITLAKNVTDYKEYTVTLTDTLSAGLTAPTATSAITITIKDKSGNTIDGTNIPGYTAPAAIINGQTITVTFKAGDGTKAIGNVGAALNEAVITVSYNAVLNAQAVTGEDGNTNTYSITYSNNPNGDDTGQTPDQVVKVYTYDVEIEKTDGNSEPLSGAAFTLYKKVATGTAGSSTGETIKASLSEDVDADLLVDTDSYIAVSMTEDKSGGKVKHTTSTSIDAGTYILIETTVPNGYNAYAGDTIVVKSTIDDEGNLTGLTATGPTGITATPTTGIVSASVVNNSGSVLPTTGGIGTTLFYLFGSILVIGAGVLMVTRRRIKGSQQ